MYLSTVSIDQSADATLIVIDSILNDNDDTNDSDDAQDDDALFISYTSLAG